MGNEAWAFTITHQWHSVKCGIPPKIQPHLKSSHQFYQCGHIGRFVTLWAPFLSLWQHLFFPNHHILGNFLKFVKIIHFSSEIIFGPLFIDIWRFLLVSLVTTKKVLLCWSLQSTDTSSPAAIFLIDFTELIIPNLKTHLVLSHLRTLIYSVRGLPDQFFAKLF